MLRKIEKYKVHEEAFDYRAWAVMVTADPEIFIEIVKRAVVEAKKYNINRIEFHDWVYSYPAPEGFVDNVVRYEKFDELKNIATWTYENRCFDITEQKQRVVTNEMLDKNMQNFKKAAEIVKAAGLKLNVWCHSFRELPNEFYDVYGQKFNPDNDFLYEAFRKIMDEFFEKIPEVDGLVLTSMGETKSFIDMEGNLSNEERMIKFFTSTYDVCKKHNKELVIRQFGGAKEFWSATEKMPNDIIYMVKSMNSDWEKVDMSINPDLIRAMEHRFVVEFDLRGEYIGQGFYPYVNPKGFWRDFTNIKTFKPEGCVGRIHWTDWQGKQYEWDSIFDVPNGLNVHIFSRGLCETSRHRQPANCEGEFLQYSWIKEWIVDNYGEGSWPALYEVLRETPLVVERMSTCADIPHVNHSFIRNDVEGQIFDFVRIMLKETDEIYIKDSKNIASQKALELIKKVEKINIDSIAKKEKLIRQLKIMAVFPQLHLIWILFYKEAIMQIDSNIFDKEEIQRHLELAINKTFELTKKIGSGMEKMINERVERNILELNEWINSEGVYVKMRW